ncbi:glycosyltransferase family 4 protein [Baaleninema sp.]|uniref:glycosyltransferase family 4 protein n=1 Tax=Baaleninema sp. TaxID=3101197 RepID=UPI003CFBDB86
MEKPTGISTYALNLVPHLRNLDPTLLVAPPFKKSYFSEFKHYSIPAGQTPEQGIRGHIKRLWWTQFDFPKIYRNLKSNFLFSPITEAPLGWNGRYAVTLYDAIPLRFPKWFSPMRLYHRYYVPQVLKQAQTVICISESTANDAMKFYDVPASKLVSIPLGFDRTLYRFLDRPTGNYFLYVGRHDPYKNLHRAIEAFAKLPQSIDCEFWIAGSFDRRYTPQLQTQAVELGVSDRVKFLDYVKREDLPILTNQAIALVFPSLWEGFGLPVLEAMACGCPVIASNLASIPEVAGNAALLVDPYNSEAMAAAMGQVAADDGLRSQLRQAGFERSRQFSWEKTGRETARVLQQYVD